MNLKHAVMAVMIGLGLNTMAGGPLLKSPEDIKREPDPKTVSLRPAGIPIERKTPLLVYLHCKTSSPQESQSVMEPLVEAWKCSLLMPCGSTKMGYKGETAVYDWNGQVDEAQIVKAIKETPGIDSKAVFLIGFSAGGFMAYQVALNHPELFKGVLVLGGDIPMKALSDDKVLAAQPKIPFFLVHGKKDQFFPPARGEKALAYLKAKGFPAVLETHEGGHFFPDDWFGTIKSAIDWFGTQK